MITIFVEEIFVNSGRVPAMEHLHGACIGEELVRIDMEELEILMPLEVAEQLYGALSITLNTQS